MGQIPKPVLVTVTVLLTLCVLGGFALGFLPNLKHGGAAVLQVRQEAEGETAQDAQRQEHGDGDEDRFWNLAHGQGLSRFPAGRKTLAYDALAPDIAAAIY